MSRYLNPFEPAYARDRAAEPSHRRRSRKAGRVRAFAAMSTPHPEPWPRPHGPTVPVPAPRRPLEAVPPEVLRAVLVGLHRLEAAS